MKYVGVDLHKQVISICVVDQARRVLGRARLRCRDEEDIREVFAALGDFQVVVEATASYEWFVRLVEPLADRVVLAHPRKLRVIAESTRKTDKLDAQVLAEFLALDMLPEAWRPTPRVSQHRRLVRHRVYLTRRTTSVKNKLRNILASYNGDLKGLFSEAGRRYLDEFSLSEADRFVAEQLLAELDFHEGQLTKTERQLRAFAKSAPVAEREAREVLNTIPCVGPVTIGVILSELGDVRRFRSQKRVVSYAGLAPGLRESAGRRRQLGITKEGSPLLRWALVQTAWRLVNNSRRWHFAYEKLRRCRGTKKAIVAIARRLLCMMYAMLRSGEAYHMWWEEPGGTRPPLRLRQKGRPLRASAIASAPSTG